MAELFAQERFDRVVHLAAQAGVRYSLVNPHAYIDSNIVGFTNVLEGCRHNQRAAPGLCVELQRLRRQHPDAVLGARQHRPPGEPVRGHQEGQRADGAHLQPPVRPADHRACASSPCTGPGAGPTWRCSCSPRRSSKAARSTSSTTARWCATSPTSTTSPKAWCACWTARPRPTPPSTPARPDPARSNAPYRVFNIGNSDPVQLMDFIEAIEACAGQGGGEELPAAAGRRRAGHLCRRRPNWRRGPASRRPRRCARASAASCSGIAATTGFDRRHRGAEPQQRL